MSRNLRREVFKFGGTSVGSSDAIKRAVKIVRAASGQVVVVVSAMGGMTDLLLQGARRAAAGNLDEAELAIAEFRRKHFEAVENLVTDPVRVGDLRRKIENSASEFQAICSSLAVLRELTPRIIDVSVARGERISAEIFLCRLQDEGVASQLIDATQLLFVEKRYASLVPNRKLCSQGIGEKLIPALDSGKIVVVPGFIATGPEGELLTLGRGGSDYSATLLAEALGASQVTLYKEVDGFLTADPRYVPDARVVPELNYREATELAYYGAKVLHPRTIIPLLSDLIPLTIKNSHAPEFPGTKVTSASNSSDFPVKALTAMVKQALVTVAGNGMLGVPGIAGKTFSTLAANNISVSVISQASSESSICFVVSEEQAVAAQRALNDAFEFERSAKLIDDVRIRNATAVLAIVGLGMKGTPGIAARVFSAFSRRGINIVAIAQGSSELNISVVLDEADVAVALKELHLEFRLEKLRPLPERIEKNAGLALFGCGQIGRSLIKQLLEQETYFRSSLGVGVKIVTIADRSGAEIRPQGFSRIELEKIIDAKSSGKGLGSDANLGPMPLVRKDLFSHALAKGIFVDVTADETYDTILEFVEQGFHVVLANKKPLTVSNAKFQKLLRRASEKNVSIRYEATVGAGLPVLDTIAKLQAAGDTVKSLMGCLSGTLGYLTTEMAAGRKFSDVVSEARRLGYTEPHPADDLSGMDVARKALILARTIGYAADFESISIQPLFPNELYHSDPDVFVMNLTKIDDQMARMVREGSQSGKVPRYIARIDSEGIRVGMELIDEGSPLGKLVGTSNQIVIRTRRYDINPLIVSGPGAGAEVTAAGVVNDVVAIAVSHYGV